MTWTTTHYDASIFIVTTDNESIHIDEFDPLDASGVFIMLTNDELNQDYSEDNSICMHRDSKQIMQDLAFRYAVRESGIIWSKTNVCLVTDPEDPETMISTEEQVQRVLTDFNGHGNTNRIIAAAARICGWAGSEVWKIVPAAYAATHTDIMFNGCRVSCYLPSAGQLRVINRMGMMLNDILRDMLGTRWFNIKDVGHNDRWFCDHLWSSNEYDREFVFVLDRHICLKMKTDITCGVLPLFKLR